MMWHSMEIEATLCPFQFHVTDRCCVRFFFLYSWFWHFQVLPLIADILLCPRDAICQKRSVLLEIALKGRHRYQLGCSGTKLLSCGASQILKMLHHDLHRTPSLKYWKLCDDLGDYMLKSSWSTWPVCVQESSKPA